MRREITVQGASFYATSDLTIVAPIKKGFVPSLDAVTYKTRVKRVLKTLHLGRQTAHEYEFARVLSDAVERVGRIHSIRIAILEPEDKVMLAVTFDGSWESYIRVIWQKVSRSLDLIFCNTEDYVTGWDHSFEQWCVWLRKSQAESPFLYSPPGLSYQDTVYLRMFERRLRHDGTADLAATRIRIPTAENTSDQMSADATDPASDGLDLPVDVLAASRPAFRQGMRSLVGLYRLLEVHLPDSSDGLVLHRAATELLREFVTLLENPAKYEQALKRAEVRFRGALDWLRLPMPAGRTIPLLPADPDLSELADVQGGIVRAYPKVSEGCLVLVAAQSAAALGDFLAGASVTKANEVLGPQGVALNISLTPEGLRLAGLGDDEMAALPREFVEGMERRAGTLGDVRINHPRRWRLPPLNWAQGAHASEVGEDDPSPRVNLGSVHLVVQLRLCDSPATQAVARETLLDAFRPLLRSVPGIQALSLQWMHSLRTDDGSHAREHFGFLDGQSQPVLARADAGVKFKNQVHLGEVLLGYANAADDAPPEASQAELAAQDSPQAQRLRHATHRLLRNGSFLVVRKLRQDIGELEAALDAGVDAMPSPPQDADAAHWRKAQRELLLAKMMGRWPMDAAEPGKALASSFGKSGNDFNFNNDARGGLCPFHAHIRRANPRDTSFPEPPGARPARLVRRGMAYGPKHDPRVADAALRAASLAQERGMVFMAYNASIGEQFEVVQRWLSGGNSSGSYSGQSDPFLGLAEPGRPRVFRFEHDEAVVGMRLDGSRRAHDEPRPFVRLEWGLYLFTPSISALRALAERARGAGAQFAKSWSEEAGEQAIARLRGIEASEGLQAAFAAWKSAIEDPDSASDFTAASIWAAIRSRHGGVLETPLGVLAASRERVDDVLLDRHRNLTATGYLPRMQRSFGPLYLGLDAGHIDGVYELESVDVNAAIMQLVATPSDRAQVVAEAASVTRGFIDELAATAVREATEDQESHWEVGFEARELIDKLLAHFCEKWFGLSEQGNFLQFRGAHLNWRPGNPEDPPCYPGHFMAPSRYTFQPHPGPEVERVGAEHGLALRVAIQKYLDAFGSDLSAPVAKATLNSNAAKHDATFPARTLAGVLMGFLPTTDGNLRRVLNEWLNEGTLWGLRAQHGATAPDDAAGRAALAARLRRKFIEAMQLRAAPELLWRTAAVGHDLGTDAHKVMVRPGQIVIASLISATQQCLEAGDPTLAYAFGGDRGAPAHPTHACPGRGPAEAVMLGFFQALVESPKNLRPGPGPLSFYMDGRLAVARQSQGAALEFSSVDGLQRAALPGGIGVAFKAAATQPILVMGDSWLTDLGDLPFLASLAASLRRLGYRFDPTAASKRFRDIGMQLSTLARDPLLSEIGQFFADLDPAGFMPKAVLLGGGGNDLVDPAVRPKQTRLYKLLQANATDAANALIGDELSAFVDVDLFGHYLELLDTITAAMPHEMPILLHAYAHPFADGRHFEGLLGWGRRGPWLESVFDERHTAPAIRNAVMATLISRLNDMLKRLQSRYPGVVHHVDLQPVFAGVPGYPGNYKAYWANELHPTDTGFDLLAQAVQAKLGTLGV